MDGESLPPNALRESVAKELLRYVRFTPVDTGLLQSLLPHAEPHFERIATEFYERIREHDDAHEVFAGEEQIARLHTSLVRWMQRLCAGPHDDSYYAQTAKIGRVHVQIGLPQRYMLSAIALIRIALLRVVDETMGAQASACREALHRALDVDLAVMLESYREHFDARLQQRARLERAEVDMALRRTEHRYVSAVELARVLIVGIDRAGNIRLFNREAERVTGRGREEVLDKPFVSELIADSLREDHGDLLRSALETCENTGKAQDFDSLLATRSGKLRDVRWQLAYAPGQEDDIVVFAVGRDTTEDNARAQRARQTEKLAAVGTLAAGLAHEIRNPLNGAQLHATFLERGLRKSGAKPEQLEALHVVIEEIKRLGNLVSEFLDFARPKPLDLRPTSLRSLCERATQLISPVAEKIGGKVCLELPAHDVTLDIDAAKMEQVLLNLLQNSVEALEPVGGGTITLRTRRRPRHVVIEVEDDGPGLPNQDAPIFDPFFSTKPNGTGLGLSIVHRIITDHGGTIDVDSRGGSTIFRITVPIRIDEKERPDKRRTNDD